MVSRVRLVSLDLPNSGPQWECMQLFNCQFIKDDADKRRQNFVKKYSVSRNSFYKLFT